MSRLPRHSTVAAYLALFLTLGGTSYAVVNLPPGSVGASELRKNAVRSADVKNRSLKGIDFKKGSLPTGRTGASGPAGPAGATGPAGPTGPAGTARAYARINVGLCGSPGPCTLDRDRGVSAAERLGTGVYCVSAPGISSATGRARVRRTRSESSPSGSLLPGAS